ncbi:MAG: ClpXP protease specificity-enhancing factor [Rhodanobacter sp.]|jgi:stringent starvation protein B|uniref:ClpXP protease specificity-enhancing factor n=1 Tax=Rhodanobacter sp. KK11 TaxID=3083255 RepID=UPI002966E483|nr:ClpXP protease specificity-enhancing factor [Rhodanobacter sp. KK11]MDW2981986.1 ClpXP protease specificity-enhancing factor [Rhodanobacter sp. KK11]
MSKNEAVPMTTNRPYLLRAIYDWISDNDLTPYVLVDAGFAGVRVPPQVVKNGQVVLNLAMRAVANLDLGNEWISFEARFSGVSQAIRIPVQAVLALYAQENGQGMMFPAEEEGDDTPPPAPEPDGTTPAPGATDVGGDRPKRGMPHLRVVK